MFLLITSSSMFKVRKSVRINCRDAHEASLCHKRIAAWPRLMGVNMNFETWFKLELGYLLGWKKVQRFRGKYHHPFFPQIFSPLMEHTQSTSKHPEIFDKDRKPVFNVVRSFQRTLASDQSPITCCRLSPDGEHLAVGFGSGILEVFHFLVRFNILT